MQATTPMFNVAYLRGLLDMHNIENYGLDVNLLIWNHFFSKKYINSLNYNQQAVTENKCPFCPPISLKKFIRLKKDVLMNIDYALKVCRSKDAYDFMKFIWAQNTLYRALSLIYYSTGTFFTTHMPYWEKIGFNVNNLNDINRLSQNSPLVKIIEESVIPEIKRINPDIILVDIMFPWDIITAQSLNILLKKHLPNVHINYAGQGFDEFSFSRLAKFLETDLRYFFHFDSIFIYRNDEGIISLINNVNSTSEKLEIENLYYIDSCKIVQNQLSKDHLFNDRIIPNYEGIKWIDYQIPESVIIDRLSYRCFWAKCSYCSINSNKIHEQKPNIDHQIYKLKELTTKYPVKNFWFLDEGCPIKTALEFAEKLIATELKISWSLRTRIDNEWNAENLQLMYNSGLRELWIGLEHVTPEILEKMNKTKNPETYSHIAARILEDATKIGIGIHFCHILGFPSETEKDRKDVLDFYERSQKAIKRKPFFTTFNIFMLMYDSPMYKEPEKFGITIVEHEMNDGFHMIGVPYLSENNDSTQNESYKEHLSKWSNQYLKKIVSHKFLIPIWFNVSDSPYEFLFKKHYSYNPFQIKLNIGRIISLFLAYYTFPIFNSKIKKMVRISLFKIKDETI
jgi:radical SAM superfamily enzyme YgiQ (UPF0313 family)